MLQRVVLDKAVAGLGEGTRQLAWAPRTGAVQQTLRSGLSKTLPPLTEGGIGKVKRR